ncbi:MAG: carbohydrate kinase family protein [Candidatus Wildermuthbacteria bacterium]|nr:carbohydrate kinase family protein [Candidatus Wildermuthbacteria bacterium]
MMNFFKYFDLIAVGDTQYDVFLELEEETKIIRDPETQRDYLGLVNAEKIPVKRVTHVPAVGNSANVAIGASRLGLKTALYTHLGNDATAKEELKVFKEEKVARDYIVFDRQRESNFTAALNYQGERTLLVHHEPRDYTLPSLAPAEWMYYSSLAAGHEKLHGQIPSYVKKNKVKLGFNPGSHQLKEGLAVLRPILQVTHILFLNKEESELLLGRKGEVRELLRGLRAEGPAIVVITDGPKGSYCDDGTHTYFLEVFQAPIVERTGAGDSYAAGFISALAYKYDIKEAMRWGTFNSASVIQKIGAREGLLQKHEMERVFRENPNFQPRIFQ